MPNLEDAIALAVKAHKGQVDKADQVYILHPLRVMFAVDGEIARMVAVLHDVIEDSDTTLDDLLAMGYPNEVISALDCLTRREDESYMEFVQRAKVNPIAREVKLADMEDNMDIRRLTQITDKDRERLNRYRNAWKFLKGD